MVSTILLLTAATVAQPFTGLLQKMETPAAAPADKPKEKITRLATPADALAFALADLRAVPPTERIFTRYIWVMEGHALPLGAKGVSLALNMVSRASVIQRPVPLGKGHLLMMRFDIRSYAPRKKDLEDWLRIWEEFQFDPKFSLLLTKGTLKFATALDVKGKGFVVGKVRKLEKVEPYEEDGKRYNSRWVTTTTRGLQEIDLKELKDVDLIRLPGRFIDVKVYAELVEMTGSQAPVVSDGYFVARTLQTIQDKGVYTIIYGGLYYQLVGVKKNAVKDATDEDVLFEQLGIGNLAQKIDAKKVFDAIPSDNRAAVFRSLVTGSPRRIDFFRSLAGRFDETTGLVSITHDLKNQNVDIDTHPVANLLDFKDDARELIWEKPNALHGYAAFNGDGVLQDEVPFDVASDHTIPEPHTRRLQAAISCIRCHEKDGSDGWKKVINDVATLVEARKGQKRLDIFGDTTDAKADVAATVDRLAGLYKGKPERKAFPRGRDDYAEAVLNATGPWPESKNGQADAVKLAAAQVSGTWDGYFYDLVTPQKALRELGIDVADAKEAQATLNKLLEPDKRAAVPVPEVSQIIVPEDPRIGALKAGIPITRADFDLVYAFLADRVQQSLGKIQQRKAA